MTGNPATGFSYLIRGSQLLTEPGLRMFVIVPLLINIVIFSALIALSVGEMSSWIDSLMGFLPDWEWLSFIRWIIWPIAVGLLLTIVMYSFSIIANIIAAPFNGLLAEKVEERLTGKPVSGNENFTDALKDAPRTIMKELHKLLYYIPRALIVAIISLICFFIFPPLSTILWFLLGAWMLSLNYCDFPMDNHKHSLSDVKKAIAKRRMTSMGFGSAAMLGTMIPIVNFIIMPAAVCGATIYWVEELSREQLEKQ
ncbi:sulfate transporter CysZ [bacterium]|nr:sulfate transporter CysZ [bacterium]